MKKVLFITNIPAPYRIDFYNELGKYVDLTVLFEAKGASDQGIRFNWNLDKIEHFKPIFLSDGNIKERKVDWSIFKYLGRKKYDEIVVTNYSYFTEMVALLYLKIMRIPYYMETDGGIIRKENGLKRIYKRILVSGAKGYFSPSESSDQYLAFYGAKYERIYRYPFTSLSKNDIMPSILSDDDREKIKNRLDIKEKTVILGVGQFIHRKGWDTLIKAATKINSDCGIYIIGGIAGEEYYQLAKDTQIPIHFLEFMDKKTLSEYYKVSDVFVLPTREDIWGLVINESLAYGLPVITTENCVAGLELIKNGINGCIIPCDDQAILADAINTYLASDKQIMRENCLKVISDYTIENMAKQHVNIFEK